jgi:uncharacterized Fe-S radical SAM superfamily protein PflX
MLWADIEMVQRRAASFMLNPELGLCVAQWVLPGIVHCTIRGLFPLLARIRGRSIALMMRTLGVEAQS